MGSVCTESTGLPRCARNDGAGGWPRLFQVHSITVIASPKGVAIHGLGVYRKHWIAALRSQ